MSCYLGLHFGYDIDIQFNFIICFGEAKLGYAWRPYIMVALVARTGRHRQRYHDGSRLVAGCIPYRYKKTADDCNSNSTETRELEVLMVTPQRRQGLLFPKGGWEDDETKEEAACREALEEAGVKGEIECCLGSWDFMSTRHQKDRNVDGCRKGYMFVLVVTEELESWPEKDARQRKWVTVREARDQCKLQWMCLALDKFEDYFSSKGVSNSSSEFPDESFSDSFSQFSDEEEHSQQCRENSECEDERPRSIIEDIPLLTEESASSSCDE